MSSEYLNNTAWLARFWAKVERGEEDDCWEWVGSKSGPGYGTMGIPKDETGYRTGLAHRLSFMLAHGLEAIEDGMFVCHHCDNPSCVNPKHLFLGTNGDNVRDLVSKGRHRPRRGETNPQAKLTGDQVRQIRSLFEEGVSKSELSRTFNVSHMHIRNILDRKKWNHI